MANLEMVNLYKAYGSLEVLKNINLNVVDGEFVVFIGPSGCGKSTLLRLICGLDNVSSGSLVINDEIVNDVPPSKRDIAMVFQSYALYPHMTVAQNMGYALKLAGASTIQILERVNRVATVLKIDHLLGRKPRQLSGGQRQRVAIARAIVREPRIFLFDEPLSNLDASLRVDMRMEFLRLKGRLGTTMIYVTHDQVEAMTLADKIVIMNDGSIEQVGTPIKLYRQPANRFVAGFIGSPKMNFLARAKGKDCVVLPGGHLTLPNANAAVSEIGVRPEHLRLGNDGAGCLNGTVEATEHLGSDTFVHVRLPHCQRPLMVRLSGERGMPPARQVDVTFDAADCHAFDRQGFRVPLTSDQANTA